MLAPSIAATALSDLANAAQLAVAPKIADGFQALLNTGSGGGLTGNAEGEQPGSSGSTPPAYHSQNPPTNNRNIFAAVPQNNSAPAPHPPQQSQQSQQQSASNNAGNAKHQTQNAPSPPAAGNSAPAHTPDSGNQNTNTHAALQPAAQDTAGQQGGGNTVQAAKQLRSQIDDQLNNISDLLLSMIQALSAVPAQQAPPVITNAAGTTSLPAVTLPGNNAAGPANGQPAGGGTATGREIALLKDMQSLLQQLQQSLAGQGQSPGNQNGQNNLQPVSDALLADMAQLSQLVNTPATNSDSGNAPVAVQDTTPFSSLSGLLKNSIAQIRAQLQSLQASNDTIFAQASANAPATSNVSVSIASAVVFNSPKTTQDGSNAPANTPPVIPAGNAAPAAPAAPVSPDTGIKPAVNTLSFNPPPVVQANVSQGNGNPAGGNSQNPGRDQAMPPVVAAAPSSLPSPSAPTGGASFARVLSQVSQSDVLNQIQFQVKTMLADGSSKITIQLNPPDLGKVDVKLDVSADGKASGVTITATNQSTLNLLKNDTQGLTRALNDAGLSMDGGSLSFSLSGGWQQNQAQAGSQQAATTYQQAQPEPEEPDINAISKSYVVNLAEGLDITI